MNDDDLRRRFRTLDRVTAPDIWREMENQHLAAAAAAASPPRRSSWPTAAASLVVLVLAAVIAGVLAPMIESRVGAGPSRPANAPVTLTDPEPGSLGALQQGFAELNLDLAQRTLSDGTLLWETTERGREAMGCAPDSPCSYQVGFTGDPVNYVDVTIKSVNRGDVDQFNRFPGSDYIDAVEAIGISGLREWVASEIAARGPGSMTAGGGWGAEREFDGWHAELSAIPDENALRLLLRPAE